MALELEGTILTRMQPIGGQSARGAWRKQEFVLEYSEGKIPSKLMLHVWGDEMIGKLASFSDGARVKVSISPSSREVNGRWYTDIRAWRIEAVGAAPVHSNYETSAGAYSYPSDSYAPSGADLGDDLPF